MPSAFLTSMSAVSARPSRALHLSLWLVQVLLAGVFFLVGYTHALAPIEVAIARAPWAAALPVALIRFIGVVELAGGIGVVLPAATRVLPGLTPLAAAGLAIVMALAIPFHLLRGEVTAIGVNLALGALAAFVAWGRTRGARIHSRG
jgi:hypothetical protein